MEVADGCDIVESVSNFARRRQRGVCIMSGTGTVTNVTLRQPASSGAVVSLHGRFEILSLMLGDATAPLFHGLNPNLLNSVQMPTEAFWNTPGRSPY
ncbi:hypothetical protein Ahy_Scaffold1g106601 isoform C [Arachis hypogaea]|uniref:PPC domain-containing protein n=1 Tax=Arachis hypogaea TaxID=3818 RepID=A0A444WQQ6_ARAHY|nr:hypothetical protein Ahy_Scaffold1g106601 isoform C [Arachis hypogaea]